MGCPCRASRTVVLQWRSCAPTLPALPPPLAPPMPTALLALTALLTLIVLQRPHAPAVSRSACSCATRHALPRSLPSCTPSSQQQCSRGEDAWKEFVGGRNTGPE